MRKQNLLHYFPSHNTIHQETTSLFNSLIPTPINNNNEIFYTKKAQTNLTSTNTFSNCLWETTSSPAGGGAIYVNDTASLTLHNCLFLSCKSLTVPSDWDGGGALCSYTTGVITITHSSFIHCNTGGPRGGAIHIRYGADVSISEGLFVDCSCSAVGGGILTEWRPSLSLSDSKFVGCNTQKGGACSFHERKSTFSISNCLFSYNQATDATRGGGAIEDYIHHSDKLCKNSFSFFHANTAAKGKDIAVHNSTYRSSPLVYCFSTAKENRFYNYGTHQNTWLPLTTISEDL